MILDHQHIDLYGKPLFTWVQMETPSYEVMPIPSEACFAYIVDGENQKLAHQPEIKAKAGQMILSLCGMTMGKTIAAQEKGRISTIIVHFHPEMLKELYQNSPPPFWKELEAPVVHYIVQMAASELVKSYFDGIVPLFRNRAAVSEPILILKLQELILLLLQTPNAPQVTQIMRSLFSTRTFSFQDLVEAHICTPVTIENLAQLTHHSLSSFKREFKRIYNTTPGSYIIEKRAEKVASLLKVSDEPISSIGYQCGFNSPAHLSRVFKAKYGVSPSAYRMSFSGN